MYFSSPLVLALALAPSTIFALPTLLPLPSLSDVLSKRQISASKFARLTDPICNLDGVQVPLGGAENGIPLPAVSPGLKLHHIAIGRGTQNYTCASSSPSDIPAANGALATLFNATCAASRAPATVAATPKIALSLAIPTGAQAEALTSGYHLFTNRTTALFNLDVALNAFGIGSVKKAANTTAPADAPKGANQMGAVPWLKLVSIDEDEVFQEVYRVDTAGGSPPKTCEGITGEFTVEYAAAYYFYTAPES